MPTETTYTALRENLASVLDQVVDQQETVIVRRGGARDVALVPASELAGLIETAHLLRSPRNAQRLLAALERANGENRSRQRYWSCGEKVGFNGKSKRAAIFQSEFREDLRITITRPLSAVHWLRSMWRHADREAL